MDPLAKKLQEAVDLDDIPGAVATGSDRTGAFTYNKAFGNRTLHDGSKKPMDTGDVISVYSATKVVTAIAVLQCVEKGLLAIDEPISRVLEHFKTVKVLTGIDDGKPQYEEPKKPVTLRHLLTHSSGTPYDMMDPMMKQWREADGSMAATQAGSVEARHSTPLAFQPGTKFGYGTGLDWAGHAVELVTSQTLGEYFEEHIFKPVGAVNASFFPQKDAKLKELMVDLNPSDPNGYGLASVGGISPNIGATDCFGGQGLFIPAQEYVKVLKSILADDGKLLQSESVDHLFEPSLEPEARENLNGEAGSFYGSSLTPGTQKDYALGGMLIQQDQPGWYKAGVMTWGGALNSVWFIDRKTGLCGYCAPQMPMRGAPFAQGAKETKPHREGALPWMENAVHQKQSCLYGLYEVFGEWQEKNKGSS